MERNEQLPPGVEELRRFIRHKVVADGTMRHQRRKMPVRVRDLSEQGCQIWLTRSVGLARGAQVTLYVENLGPFEAIVRWHRDGWVGAEFDFPVYRPVLEHLQTTYQPQQT